MAMAPGVVPAHRIAFSSTITKNSPSHQTGYGVYLQNMLCVTHFQTSEIPPPVHPTASLSGRFLCKSA